LPSAAMALGGSVLGSSCAVLADEFYLRIVLFIALPVVAFYIFKNKNFIVKEAFSRKRTLIYSMAISFCIGIYDGFYGPGTGTFLIILFTAIARIDPLTASANAKLINLASNVSALVVFIINAKVIFPLGAAAGIFSIAGSYLGSTLAIKKGSKIIRGLILFVLALLTAKIIYDFIF
jgi:uncharacterized membrane protein YfcA